MELSIALQYDLACCEIKIGADKTHVKVAEWKSNFLGLESGIIDLVSD